MRSIAVIGCGFGDEGKGRIVNDLCPKFRNPLVVRYSGGHQAGHHVVTSTKDHVFSNFGSGSLAGTDTYWSKFCTVDPMGIFYELTALKRKGFFSTLYVDKDCPVTTPYEKQINFVSMNWNHHGSCGVGFGATHEREEKRYSLLFSDLFDPIILDIKLNLIKKFYKEFSLDLNPFRKFCEEVVASKDIHMVSGIPDTKYDTIIFEGSQGLLLDQDIGFFPHVTRSNTGSKNILEMRFRPSVVLVTRAYQTRRGNGPMTNETIPHEINRNPLEENFDSGPQGKFRKTILDLNLLKYAIEKDSYIAECSKKIMVVTCMDLMPEYSLTQNGKILKYRYRERFLKKIGSFLNIPRVIGLSSPV